MEGIEQSARDLRRRQRLEKGIEIRRHSSSGRKESKTRQRRRCHRQEAASPRRQIFVGAGNRRPLPEMQYITSSMKKMGVSTKISVKS